MLVYLDMCCLKRPFDDQSQSRIRLETEAVLTLLAAEGAKIQFVRSSGLLLENSLNPLPERAERVEKWLRETTVWHPEDESLIQARIEELINLGFKNFDALHLAGAETLHANYLLSTDDRMIALAGRLQNSLRTQVRSILKFLEEHPL